jgi:hypothetical protein
MSLRRAGGLLLLVLAFAAASFVGWWMVPVAALLWGTLRPPMRRPAATAALAAGTAAVGWLVVNAVIGAASFTRLNRRLAELLPVPAPVLLAVAVLVPALLAWSAAAVGALLRPGPPNLSQSNL